MQLAICRKLFHWQIKTKIETIRENVALAGRFDVNFSSSPVERVFAFKKIIFAFLKSFKFLFIEKH